MARCVLKWIKPPRAYCACGRTLELDAYTAGKSPRVQEDALLDAYNDHARSKGKDAPANQ